MVVADVGCVFFFFTDPATAEIYTLSLHDALPISLLDPLRDAAKIRAFFIHPGWARRGIDRKSTRLNSSHQIISYAVFCLKKKNRTSGPRRDTARAHAAGAPPREPRASPPPGAPQR